MDMMDSGATRVTLNSSTNLNMKSRRAQRVDPTVRTTGNRNPRSPNPTAELTHRTTSIKVANRAQRKMLYRRRRAGPLHDTHGQNPTSRDRVGVCRERPFRDTFIYKLGLVRLWKPIPH